MVAAPSKNVGKAATSSDQVGTVYDMNPVGNVRKTTPVTFYVYGPMTTPSAPTDTVSATPATNAWTPPPTPSATDSNTQAWSAAPVTVTFGSAVCPAGQNMTGRQLYVDGKGQGPVTPASTTSTTWTPTYTGATPPPAQTFQLTYTIFCGESVESPQSPQKPYTVAAPSP